MTSTNHEKIDTEKVCQNDGQRVEKGWKMEPKWHPNHEQIDTKFDVENDRKVTEKT